MIKKIIINIKKIENSILKTMFIGFKISFIICLLSCLTLLLYIFNPISYIIYECGISLLKLGITFVCAIIICGIITDNLKKGLI